MANIPQRYKQHSDDNEPLTQILPSFSSQVYEVYEIIANAFVEKGSEEKGKEMFGKASEAAAKAGLASKAMELGSKS